MHLRASYEPLCDVRISPSAGKSPAGQRDKGPLSSEEVKANSTPAWIRPSWRRNTFALTHLSGSAWNGRPCPVWLSWSTWMHRPLPYAKTALKWCINNSTEVILYILKSLGISLTVLCLYIHNFKTFIRKVTHFLSYKKKQLFNLLLLVWKYAR